MAQSYYRGCDSQSDERATIEVARPTSGHETYLACVDASGLIGQPDQWPKFNGAARCRATRFAA